LINKIFNAIMDVESAGALLGIKPDLAHVRDKLETRVFSLVVLGQFKRGKTTFINALLGREFLPSAVVPLTAVPTILRYGETYETQVIYKDGTKREIPIKEIDDYVTEKGNPKNEKNVQEVVVRCPCPMLREMHIVDTPGVGSIHRHNTDVALEFLPKCDVAVFLLSADQPISEHEHEFLKDVRVHAEKIFFLLNKVDYLGESELDESVEFTKDVLGEDVKGEVRLFPISARLALEGRLEDDAGKVKESRILDFEDALWTFLDREKEDVLLASSRRQILGEIRRIVTSVEIERKALLTPVEELEEKLDRFNAYLAEVEKRKDYALFLFERDIQGLMGKVKKDLEDLYEDQLLILQGELESFCRDRSRISTRILREEVQGFVNGAVEDLFQRWITEESGVVEAGFQKALEKADGEINAIVSDIQRTSSDIFEVDLGETEKGGLLTPEIRFSFLFNYKAGTFTVARSFLLSLMPGFISHRFVLKGFKEELAELLDCHCGRAREDFTRRILESERKQRKRLETRIVAVVEGINSAIERAKGMKEKSRTEGEKRLSVLEECRDRFEDILGGLES
jgi:small GTP-binding protein